MGALNIYTKREIKRDGYTISRMRMDESGYFCDILEPTDKGLTSDMTEAEIKAKKIKGKTAIPTGTYEVIWVVSPTLKNRSYAKKYGGKFPCIIGIKGFSGVLIHPGNTSKDTEACLLPGIHTSAGRVSDSQRAYTDFMDYYFVPAMNRGDKCYITID